MQHQQKMNDFFSLFLASGWVAQTILCFLFLASILCWAIIIKKSLELKKSNQDNATFEKIFYSKKSLDQKWLNEISVHIKNLPYSALAKVFESAYQEMTAFSFSDLKIENMSRALNKQTAIELEENEKNIAFLASISSAAPFLGLFGTVWGIMNAFQNIATSQSASLSVVAPGISEALITTAIGIGTAIPAVLGYNFFIGKNRQLATRIDCFSQDLLNLIERSSSEKKK